MSDDQERLREDPTIYAHSQPRSEDEERLRQPDLPPADPDGFAWMDAIGWLGGGMSNPTEIITHAADSATWRATEMAANPADTTQVYTTTMGTPPADPYRMVDDAVRDAANG